MKKVISVLLAVVSLMIVFFISGCFPSNINPIEEGIYVSENEPFYVSESDERILHNKIKKVKLNLRRIDKDTFYNANGINVIEDTTQIENKYFSFELYFFIKDVNGYINIIVKDVNYVEETPQYQGKMDCLTQYYAIDAIFKFTISGKRADIIYGIEWVEQTQNTSFRANLFYNDTVKIK